MTRTQLIEEIFFLDGRLQLVIPFLEFDGNVAPIDLACWNCNGVMSAAISDTSEVNVIELWKVYFCLRNYITSKELVYHHYLAFKKEGRGLTETRRKPSFIMPVRANKVGLGVSKFKNLAYDTTDNNIINMTTDGNTWDVDY